MSGYINNSLLDRWFKDFLNPTEQELQKWMEDPEAIEVEQDWDLCVGTERNLVVKGHSASTSSIVCIFQRAMRFKLLNMEIAMYQKSKMRSDWYQTVQIVLFWIGGVRHRDWYRIRHHFVIKTGLMVYMEVKC